MGEWGAWRAMRALTVLRKKKGGRHSVHPGVHRPRSTDKPLFLQEKDQARPHKSPEAGVLEVGRIEEIGGPRE